MTDRDDAQVERLDAAQRRFYATERRSLRWWKHAREYVSLLRLIKNGLLREGDASKDGSSPAQSCCDNATAKDGLPSRPLYQSPGEVVLELPSHPPWDARGWRWNTPDGKAPFRY